MKPEQADRWLSAPRFRNFLNAADGHHDRAVALYAWNAEISAALLETLHHVEVLLRNAIDRQFPKTELDCKVSICNADVWLTDPAILEDPGREKVNDAISRLTGESRSPTRPRLVASLTLGFWVALFAGRYEDLWRSTLLDAFPNGDGRRNQVRKVLARILQLRNQIAHHEAIFDRDLHTDHAAMLDVAGLIDAEARDYIASLSKVGDLLSQRRLNFRHPR
jgi:Abi-like protein